MKVKGLFKILICAFTCVSIGFTGLAVYLLMQDAKVKDNSLYGSPLSQSRLLGVLKTSIADDLDTIETYANVLMERNPRMGAPRRALVSVYAQRGELEGLERVFYPLFSIDPENTVAYASVLAKMSTDPLVFERARIKVLEEKPLWGGLYLRLLISESSENLSDYQELIRLYPRQTSAFIWEVMKKISIEQAYISFKDIKNISPSTSLGIVDPEFKEELTSWPFGWLLGKDLVSHEPGGGIAVIFFGRGAPVIAEQVVRVETGRHQLIILASGEASRTKGYYKLEARCWQSQNHTELILDNLSAVPLFYVLAFNTSEWPGCDFVHIRLIGQAGAFPAPVKLNVRSINLRPGFLGEAQ